MVIPNYLINRTAFAQESPDDKPLNDPPEIVLTRFAMQTLYAPSRLIPSSERISRAGNPAMPKAFPLMQSTQGRTL